MAEKMAKLVSWNVNGLNAVLKKGFMESFGRLDADIFALQETKLQEIKLTSRMRDIPGYQSYWSFSTVKKGYSGVAVYTRVPPKRVNLSLGDPRYDEEGRMIELEYDDFVFFNVYFPNGQMNDDRLQYKLDFYDDFLSYAESHRKKGKRLVITGDFNTAHNEIDLAHPKRNEKTSGFLPIERDWMDRLVASGYVDTFRHLYPDTVKYSWWSYISAARSRNVGWRIDYFFVTEEMLREKRVTDAFIDNDVLGSDHCPIGLVLSTR